MGMTDEDDAAWQAEQAEAAEALAELEAEEAARDVTQARLRQAVLDAVPADPERRREFIDWYIGRLFEAAPDKAAFLTHLDDCIDRALAMDARDKGQLQ
jgi:hypothetical protein